MQSGITKRSVVIKGHKTSVSLEEPFWSALWEIARSKGSTMGGLVAQIDFNVQARTCAVPFGPISWSISKALVSKRSNANRARAVQACRIYGAYYVAINPNSSALALADARTKEKATAGLSQKTVAFPCRWEAISHQEG